MEIDIVEGRDPRTINKLSVNNYFWENIKSMKNYIKDRFGFKIEKFGLIHGSLIKKILQMKMQKLKSKLLKMASNRKPNQNLSICK